jgi:superfamily I DNA/RNA helicase
LETVNRVFSWLNDASDSVSLRAVIQAALDHSETVALPGPRSRTAAKLGERTTAHSEVASLWAGVLAGKSLADSLVEAAAAVSAPATTRAIQSVVVAIQAQHTAKSGGGFMDKLAKELGVWAKPEHLCSDINSIREELSGKNAGGGTVGVRIMTIQLSKGLEADQVHVVGLEETVFPKSADQPAVLEEKSRLLYVAMTRAKKELHLHSARTRNGKVVQSATSYQLKESPFLASIKKANASANFVPSSTMLKAKSKSAKKTSARSGSEQG